MKYFCILVSIFFIVNASFAQKQNSGQWKKQSYPHKPYYPHKTYSKHSSNSGHQKEALDRTKLPESAAAPIIKLGKVENFTLSNGLKVYVVNNSKIPKVAFNLVLDYNPILEGPYKGLTDAVGNLLSTGTKTRTKDQFDEETDFIGANISTSSTEVYATSLKKHADKLLNLMSDVVLNPNFTQEELDKVKKQMKSAIASNKENPNSIVKRVSQVVLFGKDHPYGEQMTNETVDKLNLEVCYKFYNTYFRPNIAYLAVVGDITLAEAKPLIEKYYGSWQKADVPQTITTSSRKEEKTKIILVDRPNAVQSVINVVNIAELKIGDPDVIKAKITNDILGGDDARLFNNLREKHGFTYGAYYDLKPDRMIGEFAANLSVRNAVTDSSITELLAEMNQIRNSKPADNELNRTKNSITGSFVFSLENPQTLANFAINTARYNLPGDYFSNYLRNVEAVTPTEVQNIGQKYIKPANCYIVVVGKASEIANNLKQFGEIDYYDVDGNKVAELTKITPKPIEKAATMESVLEKYIIAVGGKEKVANIADLEMTMTGKVTNGPSIKVLSTKKAPNKSFQEARVMGMVVQKTVIDGAQAVSSLRGKQTILQGDELNQALAKASMFYELNPQKFGIKAILIGTDKILGKDCQKIEYTIGEAKWIEYYDVATGLKIRTAESVKTKTGSTVTIIDYAEYKETMGIKYPSTIKQTFGEVQIILNVETVKINTGIDDKLFIIK